MSKFLLKSIDGKYVQIICGCVTHTEDINLAWTTNDYGEALMNQVELGNEYEIMELK